MKFETIRDCEILKVNNKGWQKGKLNIEICISPDTNKPDKVNLKFFPEEPIKPESTLDDIRKTMKEIRFILDSSMVGDAINLITTINNYLSVTHPTIKR